MHVLSISKRFDGVAQKLAVLSVPQDDLGAAAPRFGAKMLEAVALSFFVRFSCFLHGYMPHALEFLSYFKKNLSISSQFATNRSSFRAFST